MAETPPDENDAKRAGTFTGDPFEGVSLVPPPPQATGRPALYEDGSLVLAAPTVASPPELERHAPTLRAAYTRTDFAADKQRGLVSLERLPPWPMPPGHPPPQYGHGWGPCLDGTLAHGLRPGEMIGLGASSAGAGKTAFVMQIADGLALRNLRLLRGEDAWGDALTPVLIASEMSAAALTWRSLARWVGCPSTYFRGGQTVLRKHRLTEQAERAWEAGNQALDGEFGEARDWLRLLEPGRASLSTAQGARALVEDIKGLVEAWREKLGREHGGREIVPIVVVDPLQRYQSGRDEIGDLNALARELCAATLAGNWITLLTSDTNKASARGERGENSTDSEEGAGVFRGSYNLIHEVSAALYLRRPRHGLLTEDEEREGLRYVETVLVKARWGGGVPPWPRFRWYGATARFWPMTAEATVAHDAELARRKEEAEGRKTELRTERFPASKKISPRGAYDDEPSGLL